MASERNFWVEDPRELRAIFRRLSGDSPPKSYEAEPGHQGGSWTFALLLATMAAIWLGWLLRDLFGPGQDLLRLAACVLLAAAVALLFFISKTNRDRYEFDVRDLRCFVGKRQRWAIPIAEVDALEVFVVTRRRFYIYIHRNKGSKLVLHSHESLAKVLREYFI